MIPRLEHILMDAGGVLCFNDEAPVWRAWEQHTGLTGEVLRTELYDRGLKVEFDRGLKHPAGIALFLSMRFEVELTLDDWAGIWNRAIEPDPEMDQFARALAVHIPCSLASTTDKLHHEKMRGTLTCLELFKNEFVSYQLGYIKPDPMYYRRALERLDIDPAKVLLIDDKEENVAGALELGLQAMRFTGIDKLRQDLTQYGLMI